MSEVLEKPGRAAHKAHFPVEKTSKSKLKEIQFSHLPFGQFFSDHMLVADYADGVWGPAQILPFAPFEVSPANLTLHYGQSIFEGIKAYKNADGQVSIFRPDRNYRRFLKSADRMAMPAIPEDIFLGGMLQLVDLDREWTPSEEGSSLYIRPFMFAMDGVLGVKPGKKYRFMIITSPAGPYYNKPLRLYVEDHFVRACEGGTGFAKTAGNYAASLYPTEQILKKGYDQILWTDAKEHKYLQECGTMNFFAVLDGTVITPDLDEGTILDGVTRDTVIQILKDKGIQVEERALSIEEVLDAHRRGGLQEMFGAGTAANITFVQEFRYLDQDITLKPYQEWQVAPMLLQQLNALHYSQVEDTHGWLWKV